VRLAPRFLAEMKHQIAWIAERNPLAASAAEARVRVALTAFEISRTRPARTRS
jgi:hypothetical protein